MNYLYLLDTNIVSDLVRNPMGIIAQKIRNEGESKICTSIVVACELRFGARKSGSARLAQQLELILSRMTVLPMAAPADDQYARIRLHLEQAGTPIGPNDLLIAAHALTLGLTLVTANVREFERVPELAVANWLGIPT